MLNYGITVSHPSFRHMSRTVGLGLNGPEFPTCVNCFMVFCVQLWLIANGALVCLVVGE
jgi:hypothetical protein